MKKYSLIITIIMFPVCLIYFFYLADKSKNNLENIIKEYPEISLELSLNGIIQEKIVGGELLSNATVRIILNNDKFLISGTVRNSEYKESFLEKFIQVRDSIYKRANSDTVYVYRNDKEYYFILDQVINKE